MAPLNSSPPDDGKPVLEDGFLGISFNQAAVGLAVVALNGRWLRVNKRLCDMLQRGEDELLSTDVQTLTHPLDMRVDNANAERLLRGDIPRYEMEKRYFLPDGRTLRVLLNVSLIHGADGRPRYFFAIIQDHTRRLEMEEELRESQRLFDQLSRNSRTVLWRIDRNGIYTHLSNNAAEVHGYQPKELVGKAYYYDLCPGSERAALVAAAEEIIAERRAFRDLENPVRSKSGKIIWVSSSGIPIFDDSGNLAGYEGWETDITEMRELKNRLLRDQRLESIGLLASGIAHNLNNALTPVLLAVDLLKAGELPKDRADLVATIENCTRRGTEMVRQILSFTRGIEGNRSVTDLRGILRDLATMIGESFPKTIDFTMEVPPDLWRTTADGGRIYQVLLNLCINARDAMPDGGALRVTAENRILDNRRASGHPGAKPGPHVVLRVRDTGIGMDQETLDRLFMPFFSTKDQGKGTGLGLASSQGIVKSHGGFFEVSSEPGRGSVFAVWLPVGKAFSGAVAKSGDDGLPPAKGGETILLVDDEGPVRELASHALAVSGYRVLVACGGGDAVALYEKNKDEIDLLVTDMRMPGMDGADLIKGVRKQSPGLPVLVISGSGKTGFPVAEGRSTRFLAKPFDAPSFLRAVRGALAATD